MNINVLSMVGYIFSFLSIIFLVVGVCIIRHGKVTENRCSLEVPFEVASLDSVEHSNTVTSGRNRYYYVTYRFYVNGIEYRVRSSVGRASTDIDENKKLKVNPDNPNEIYERTYSNLGWIFFYVGLLLGFTGIIMFVVQRL